MKNAGRRGSRLLHLLWLSTYLAIASVAQQNPQAAKPTQDRQPKTDTRTQKTIPGAAILRVFVRDVDTHYAVHAKVKLEGSQSLTAETDNTGSLNVSLHPGQYRMEISAPGYRNMRSSTVTQAGKSSSMFIMLDPLTRPEEEQLLGSKLRSGLTLFHGYAVDDSGRPISGVRVRLRNAGIETFTNERGYYELLVPTPSETAPDVPSTDTLTAEKPGYKTTIHRNLTVAGEDGGGVHLDLQQGSGTTEIDDTPAVIGKHAQVEEAPQLPTPVSSRSGTAPELYTWLGAKGTALPVHSVPTTVLPQTLVVPSSIVVGLSCTNPNKISTCTTCSWTACNTGASYSLEAYVQIGLGQEWIPSWETDSLEAGAVAYRSYGSYYVQNGNPYTTNFNICSSTQCQVFNPNFIPPTKIKNAQTATASLVLSKDGVNIFKAEYAAESNLASDTTYATCPNGQVGEPANGWPCMNDPIDAGASQANTHSRGMCQWGSQRWATGKNASGVQVTAPRNWRCILNHYYNDNGDTTGAGTGLRNSFINGPVPDESIAYSGGSGKGFANVYTMIDNGTVVTQLTSNGGSYPVWQPGGAKIAFLNQSNQQAYLMNSDGSNVTQLTSTGDQVTSWSPQGDKLLSKVFDSNSLPQIFKMNSGGTGRTQLTFGPPLYTGWGANWDAAWSPDGTRIAFTTDRDSTIGNNCYEIYVMNADGSNPTPLRPQPPCVLNWSAWEPAWSPDGSKIAYAADVSATVAIFVMNADGSGPIQLTQGADDEQPSWNEDGTKIVFAHHPTSGGTSQVYSVSPNGSSETQLTNDRYSASLPNCRKCVRFDTF
jgi:Tol biopolymer transport system component